MTTARAAPKHTLGYFKYDIDLSASEKNPVVTKQNKFMN